MPVISLSQITFHANCENLSPAFIRADFCYNESIKNDTRIHERQPVQTVCCRIRKGTCNNDMSEEKVLNTADHMIRATAANGQVRAFAISTPRLVQEAADAHGTSRVATAALGRTMSAALMMADMLKGEKDLITIRIDGDGPLGGIIVTADNSGHVKGYVSHPLVVLPAKEDGHLDVGAAVGRGMLTVIRDLDMKNTYTGQVELQSGEIAEDVARYFAESEQIPSAVGLGVLVGGEEGVNRDVLCAGGYIIQLMPFASDAVISQLEENIRKAGYVTDILSAGNTPESMLEIVLEGMDPVINDSMPVSFYCNCSRERVERALLLTGPDELAAMIEDENETVLTCQFCKKAYHFTKDDLRGLREQLAEQTDGPEVEE